MKNLFLIILLITMNTYSNQAQVNDLEYLVRQPKTEQEKPPVLILLHGVGSNEQDPFSFADQLPDKFLVISVRAPLTLSEGSYAWYQVDFSSGKPIFYPEQEEKSRSLLIAFIEQLKNDISIDEKQIYLGGFSQGGIMSYSVGLTRSDLVKGIFVMSGRLLEEVKPMISRKENLEHLSIFISHGTIDPVLGIHFARESSAYLKSLSLNPTYNEYEEGHGINSAMLEDLIKWLNAN